MADSVGIVCHGATIEAIVERMVSHSSARSSASCCFSSAMTSGATPACGCSAGMASTSPPPVPSSPGRVTEPGTPWYMKTYVSPSAR